MTLGDDHFSQTQNVSHTQLVRPAVDSDVHALLVSLIDSGVQYEIRRDMKQVEIGRHPDCFVKTPPEDKRASGQHVRIYRDDAFHWFVEELSSNGAWCNDFFMKKGETRALQHGDAISVCVHHGQGREGMLPDSRNKAQSEQKPFAAYIFRLTGHTSDPAAREPTAPEPVETERKLQANETFTVQGLGSKIVNDAWVNENWDMRTLLGSGNFSEVRLGVKVKMPGSEKCAMKVIIKSRFLQFQSKRESQLSLQSEADILMSMHHPSIIKFHEWFETEEKLFIAMEFLAGGDLLQYILDNGNFCEGVARRLFKDIGNAVAYLHSKNIVHRDLKPENILLTSKVIGEMQPKLADFGLARMNMKTKDCKTFCGTPHYFAPEVIHTFRAKDDGQAGGYGMQADMWSLGVILYIMLSGIPPFEEEGLYEQILEGKYEFDVHEWNKVSPEAKELVRQLMTVDPKGRLDIKQTMAHKWFSIGGLQTGMTPPDAIRPHPMDDDTCEMSVKRARTMSDIGVNFGKAVPGLGA